MQDLNPLNYLRIDHVHAFYVDMMVECVRVVSTIE